MTRAWPSVMACLAWLLAAGPAVGAAEVDGERRLWHRVTLTFAGPATSEDATHNPFRDYRLDVTFTHPQSGETRTVPGFFAADGRAAETSATAGDCWRVHFSPSREGAWRWTVRFRHGRDVAIATDAEAGEPWAPLDGRTGELTIGPTDKRPPDFRARGTLEYAGVRYLRFAGDGAYFLKGGVGSPETLLGYADFDGTWLDRVTDREPPAPNPPISLPALRDGLHRYEPHLGDWRPGDPTWKGGKGKGLVGGLNYLASQGVNAIYFLTMNVNGDGRNAWPWTDPGTRDRFDCSKLDQWEIAFSHMTRLGLMLHVVTQETENDHLLDRGELGPERRLYYRELVARFAHHPAITWNLGEENVQGPAQQKAMAAELRRLDPYRHHVVVHNDHWHAKNVRETFDPLLGFAPLTGTALQDFHWNDVHPHVKHYVRASALAGHPWVVSADELGGAGFGTLPDADDPAHDAPRRFGLWGTLMAGGAGIEWYFGWQNGSPHSDLSAEDWRTREAMYRQTRLALDFFHEHLPFHRMEPADELVVGHGVFALVAPGEVYAIYLPNGGATRFDLGPRPGLYEVRWFDPRSGGALREGSVARVRGPGLAWTGDPPSDPHRDWLALVRRVEETAPAMEFPEVEWRRATPLDLGIDPVGLQHALNSWRMATGANGIDRVVVARRGVVVHEGKEAGHAQDVRSATKSFTSTLLGLLLAEKGLSLDDAAADHEPLLRAGYGRVTLRHSAQMMLGRVLTRIAGRDLLALLDERVLGPIGARVEHWTAEGEVEGLTVRNGCTGITIDARSLARFGHLFLNGGRWRDRQVVPAEWARAAVRPQVGAELPLADTDRRSTDGRGVYGFNWWANGRRGDGRRAMPDAPAGAFYAAGLGHNVLLVVPEWELVIVRLGEGRNPPGGHAAVLNAFLRRLGMAVHPLVGAAQGSS